MKFLRMKEAATGIAEIVRIRFRHTTTDRPEFDDLTGKIHDVKLRRALLAEYDL
jgi:hypothetical protein